MTRPKSARRGGFTLIELVLVLAIVAALAGLIIPQVASLGRSTDMAYTAKTQSDLANNLQLFFIQQKRFPQGMDSLLTAAGTLYGPQKDDGTGAMIPMVSGDSQDLQLRGTPISGADGGTLGGVSGTSLRVTDLATLPGQSLRSFTRAGFDFVYDHDLTVINSNNSGVTRRPATGVFGSSGPLFVAELIPGSVVARKLLPATAGLLPTGTTAVVALGVGPNCAAIPKTMVQAPQYPGNDGKYYGRYVAFFALYATGERATLVGVTDSYGRAPDYSIQQYAESLPDGGRQG